MNCDVSNASLPRDPRLHSQSRGPLMVPAMVSFRSSAAFLHGVAFNRNSSHYVASHILCFERRHCIYIVNVSTLLFTSYLCRSIQFFSHVA
jgi:hypothetical protein